MPMREWRLRLFSGAPPLTPQIVDRFFLLKAMWTTRSRFPTSTPEQLVDRVSSARRESIRRWSAAELAYHLRDHPVLGSSLRIVRPAAALAADYRAAVAGRAALGTSDGTVTSHGAKAVESTSISFPDALRNHDVDGAAFLDLTQADLMGILGIRQLGVAKSVLREIGRMCDATVEEAASIVAPRRRTRPIFATDSRTLACPNDQGNVTLASRGIERTATGGGQQQQTVLGLGRARGVMGSVPSR